MMFVVKRLCLLLMLGYVLLSSVVLGAEKVNPQKENIILYLGPKIEVLQDPFDQAAFDALKLKAEQGDAQSQYLLARVYREGVFVQKDYGQAFHWMSKAVAQNYTKALAFLGVMYVRGIGTPKKYVDGVALIKKAAYKGDADGQYFLGMLYVYGIGVPKSNFRAAYWLDQAYKQNHIGARGMMGYFLYHMSEKSQDKARASYLMKEACAAGDKYICHKLRFMFIRSVDEQASLPLRP